VSGNRKPKTIQSRFFVLGICTICQEPLVVMEEKTGDTYSKPYIGYAGSSLCVDCARKLGFVIEAPQGKTVVRMFGEN